MIAETADWHAHWLPPALLRLLERRSEAPRVVRLHGVPHLQAGRLTLPLGPVMVDLAARQDLLERVGISWQMLSLSSLWNVDNLPATEALPLVRAFNDGTAQAVRASSQTFGGLAALPLQDLQAAAVELRRARAAGLRGAILPAEALATLSAARELAPLLEEADQLGAHLFIHPGYMRVPVPPTRMRTTGGRGGSC